MDKKNGNKTYEIDMIGMLAKDVIVDNNIPQYPVNIDGNNNLIFTIKVLSDFPYIFEEDIVCVNGYATNIKRYDFFDDSTLDEDTRKRKLKEYLFDKLFIFHPERKQGSESAYYTARDIRVVTKNINFDYDDKMIPLPIFRGKETSVIKTIRDIEKKVVDSKPVPATSQLSYDENDYPDYFIWEDGDEKYLYGKINGQKHSIYGNTYFFEGDIVTKWNIGAAWDDYGYTHKDVFFVPQKLLLDLQLAEADFVEEKEEEVTIELEPVVEQTAEQPVTIAVTATMESDSSTVTMDTSQKGRVRNPSDEELEFVERFNSAVNEANLYYEEKDLYNFHTAMKVGNLVILAGLSGTGKSQLIKAYSKALQLGENQLNFITVRPFWQDDSDLLGYADTVNSVYRPGDSGLIETLISASKNPDSLYLVCFDEMNLARVEHYFSQFLSVLELPEADRKIRLYNEDLGTRLYNSDKYPAFVSIGRNVLFCGTINLDDTTHPFSDKVLDRSNCIALQVVPFADMYDLQEIKKHVEYPQNEITSGMFANFKENGEDKKLRKEELNCLWEIHESLRLVNRNIGVGWRIVTQINSYLKYLPDFATLKREEAFDLQLIQRIFTKVRGSSDQLNDLVGVYEADKLLQEGKLTQIMNKYENVSGFKNSREYIEQLAKEISIYGYTL